MDHHQSHLRFFLIALLSLATSFGLLCPQNSWASYTGYFAIGLPVPLALGFSMPVADPLAAEIDIGYVPIPLGASRGLSVSGIETKAVWKPFDSRVFFLGGLGYQSINLTTPLNLSSLTGDPTDNSALFGFNLLYVALGVGYSWKLTPELSIGCDLGVQFSLFSSGGVSFPTVTTVNQDLQASAAQALTYLANYPLPHINLIKLGYEF
jgi:hypothetical protein